MRPIRVEVDTAWETPRLVLTPLDHPSQNVVEGFEGDAPRWSSAAVRQAFRGALDLLRADPERAPDSYLECHVEVPDDLQDLPWERLASGGRDPSAEAVAGAVSVVRVTRRTVEARPKLQPPLARVLAVLPVPASADGRDRCLDTYSAVRQLERVVDESGGGGATLTALVGPEANPDVVQAAVEAGQDIVWFGGAGACGPAGEPTLLLEAGGRDRGAAEIPVGDWAAWLLTGQAQVCLCGGGTAWPAAKALAQSDQVPAVVAWPAQCAWPRHETMAVAVIAALLDGQPLTRALLSGRRALRAGGAGPCPAAFASPQRRRPGTCLVPEGDHPLGLSPARAATVADETRLTAARDTYLSWVPEERTQRMGAFQLAQFAVTNHLYLRYLAANHGVRRPAGIDDPELDPEAPVVGVTWREAADYCHWVGGRLPTSNEDWQRCPCVDGREPGPGAVTLDRLQTSPCGAEAMCGHVFEWTADDAGESRRVVMGGAWNQHPFLALPSLRWPRIAASGCPDVGFRCAFDGPAGPAPTGRWQVRLVYAEQLNSSLLLSGHHPVHQLAVTRVGAPSERGLALYLRIPNCVSARVELPALAEGQTVVLEDRLVWVGVHEACRRAADFADHPLPSHLELDLDGQKTLLPLTLRPASEWWHGLLDNGSLAQYLALAEAHLELPDVGLTRSPRLVWQPLDSSRPHPVLATVALVLPGSEPALAVRRQAEDDLRHAGHSSLVHLLDSQPERRELVVETVYDAFRRLYANLQYDHERALIPPDLQTTRSPADSVVQGTCIDLALLLCGALECCRLEPLLIVLWNGWCGHALVGVRRGDGDDPALRPCLRSEPLDHELLTILDPRGLGLAWSYEKSSDKGRGQYDSARHVYTLDVTATRRRHPALGPMRYGLP
ncbi:MAG: SUMF1/EgtB/PvdO family nonheme iron enzyme [Armatimonadetes bacterium]|nr:SUMF1/EgtB/PvdO family nonheme iron enzyme [Armatimonadota bacterium]